MSTMTRANLLDFMRDQSLAVIASVSDAKPRAALVIGGMTPGDERTVQYEGIADEPTGHDLELLKELYFLRLPDGRERSGWPGLMHLRLRPTWIRYSDFNQDPPQVVEFEFNT